MQLSVDPLLDLWVAAFCNRFPIVVRDGGVTLNYPHLSDLRGFPMVRLMVKAVERLTSHRSSTIMFYEKACQVCVARSTASSIALGDVPRNGTQGDIAVVTLLD